MSERLWCTACGTVTDDMLCDCNRWPDDHEMKLEPHFVNYADAMQEAAHEQAQQIDALTKALERSVVAIDDWLQTYAGELCEPDRVEEASKRIGEYGTLSYIANVQEQNRAALAKRT